jgi:hypothetical protein
LRADAAGVALEDVTAMAMMTGRKSGVLDGVESAVPRATEWSKAIAQEGGQQI